MSRFLAMYPPVSAKPFIRSAPLPISVEPLAAASPYAVQEIAVPCSRVRTALTFLLADVLALLGVGLALLVEWSLFGSTFDLLLLAPLPALLILTFGIAGLYRAAALHPAEELRQAGMMTTLVFSAYLVAVCWSYAAQDFPVASIATDVAVAWLLCLVAIPCLRAVSRATYARKPWWGTAVVVLASGTSAQRIVHTLQRWPELGLKPVAILHDAPGQHEIGGVPVLGRTGLAAQLATSQRVPYAILAMPELTSRQLSDRVRRYSQFFDRVLVVPDLPAAPALWTACQRVDGLLGFGVRRYNHSLFLHAAKRFVDVAFALGTLIVLSPGLLLIALLIKLDSPGPVLFRQIRMGTAGRCFRILKFRSMYVDAEDRLQSILQDDPDRYLEYERYHKLLDDPRVTPIGRVLRTYSLDEFPQLINVVIGDLSLVGPRAYLPRELSTMGGLERAVLQSRPGITGLWQVSGRNRLTFEERLSLDVHYIQNWTPALDLYILAKTLPVVVNGEGAA